MFHICSKDKSSAHEAECEQKSFVLDKSKTPYKEVMWVFMFYNGILVYILTHNIETCTKNGSLLCRGRCSVIHILSVFVGGWKYPCSTNVRTSQLLQSDSVIIITVKNSYCVIVVYTTNCVSM